MRSKSALGQQGENLACEYLVGKDWKVLTRNYRKPWGEIDIVARAKDNTLVFVEVKTMQTGGENSLAPEDQMSNSKLTKLKRICEQFMAKNPELLDERRGWRMDLVAISLQESGHSIRHYENVF